MFRLWFAMFTEFAMKSNSQTRTLMKSATRWLPWMRSRTINPTPWFASQNGWDGARKIQQHRESDQDAQGILLLLPFLLLFFSSFFTPSFYPLFPSSSMLKRFSCSLTTQFTQRNEQLRPDHKLGHHLVKQNNQNHFTHAKALSWWIFRWI